MSCAASGVLGPWLVCVRSVLSFGASLISPKVSGAPIIKEFFAFKGCADSQTAFVHAVLYIRVLPSCQDLYD